MSTTFQPKSSDGISLSQRSDESDALSKLRIKADVNELDPAKSSHKELAMKRRASSRKMSKLSTEKSLVAVDFLRRASRDFKVSRMSLPPTEANVESDDNVEVQSIGTRQVVIVDPKDQLPREQSNEEETTGTSVMDASVEDSEILAKDSQDSLEWYMKSVDEEEEVEEEEVPFVSVFDRLDVERECLAEPVEITEAMLKNISVQLGQIRLCWPKKEKFVIDMPNVILPDGYIVNTNKEKLLLLYCENFRVQYHAKFPNRKPLLLCGDNVVGQRKMVCTTLRPTTLPHPDLSTYQELASFVADHINYEPLVPPTEVKSRLFSPHTVFTKKLGHSFEMANALCSLLLGRNYNAYVVYGFATQDVTERIMVRTECPFEEKEETVQEEAKEEVVTKYVLRRPRDLRSKFLLAMEQKDADKVAKEKAMLEEIQRQKTLESEKAPPDEMEGRRVHGWVLIYPSPNDKEPRPRPFFIDAPSGMRYEIDSPLFCSIQSIWNNTNYWVNLQDDSIGIGHLSFDLSDLTKWEHILPGEPIHIRTHPRNMDLDEDEETKELNLIMDEKHLDMPEPWSLRVNVSPQDVKNRFPTGQKKMMYKRTVVEQFSPYTQEDGLVMRIHRYSDIECTNLKSTEERFKNRSDKLSKRLEDASTGYVTEYFDRGREDNAKEHSFYKAANEGESWRKIDFYFASRFDCLKFIEHDELFMDEFYVDREDFIHYRHTEYAKRGEPPPGIIEGPRRIIKNVKERFNRNKEKRASDDIASRTFDYVNRKMSLCFHHDVGKITSSTRVFLKPPLTEMVEGVSFRPELTYGYQAEIGARPPKNSTLYALLESQLKAEEDCVIKVRHVEDSLAEFVRLRAVEIMHPKLDVGLFNRQQNKDNRLAMLEKEAEDRTKKEREIEDELDYIRPYLVRHNYPEILNVYQALRIRNECLVEYRDMLVRRANDLQKRYQEQITYLKMRREWYNNEVENLTYEQEQDYFQIMNAATFSLHCMEIQLDRMKESVPLKIDAVVRFLRMHPALQVLIPDKKPLKYKAISF